MARRCCAVAALQLLSACIAGPAAAATPLSLDGEWQLANVGVGPLATRTTALLADTGLADAPRGSSPYYPRSPPPTETSLGSLPATSPTSCCRACAATPFCGGAVWTGTTCEMRAAGGVPHPARNTTACVLSGGSVQLNATVPGDINNEMMVAGLLPDLYHSTQSMLARWVPQYEWVLSKSFTAAELGAQDSAGLLFEGIDFNASIALNGVTLLAHHTGSFRPIHLDASSHLRAGTNKVEVRLHAPPAGYLTALFTTDPMAGGARSTYTVGGFQREHFSAWKAGVGNGGGVDFGSPAFALGIWKSVQLRTYPGSRAHLDSQRAVAMPSFPNGADLSEAMVTLRVPVVGEAVAGLGLHLRWRVQCVEDSSCTGAGPVNATVPVTAGDTVAKISLHRPSLWFPNGYGAQPLYAAHACLMLSATSESCVDSVSIPSFGVRLLELADNEPNYPAEIASFESGFPYADYGSCPEEKDCLAAGWGCVPNLTVGAKPCPPTCAKPAGATGCACPWCGGPWIRNSSGPSGPGTGQGALPPPDGTPRNITQGDETRLGWTIKINGKKIFARGGNWVPVDLFFGRVTAEWLEQTVAMSAAANMNFYR